MFGFYLCMQVSNRNNNVNFTSTPLHYVNLKNLAKDGGGGFVKAVLTRLDPNDKADLAALKEAKKSWKLKHCVGDQFLTEFESQGMSFGFNAVELVSEEPLVKKIIGLVSTSIDDFDGISLFSLNTLFTKPSFSKAMRSRKISGVGEIMLGEAIFNAKKSNSFDMSFNSSMSAVKFYKTTFEDAGIELTSKKYNPQSCDFRLFPEDFDKYINHVQKKYNMDFSATI